MKILLLAILTIVLSVPSNGQGIQRIIVTGQHADEPPTEQGVSKHTIEFRTNKKGDLIAKEFWRGNKKNKLRKGVVIESSRLESISQWIESEKKKFSLEELHMEYKALQDYKKNSSYKPYSEFDSNYVIDLDSFNFCLPYNSKRSISTGGYNLSVVMTNNFGTNYEFEFDSDDRGLNKLGLFNYIVCYELLYDKLPANFSGREHFTKTEMMTNILFAISTIECEGFYYKEFIDKHPERTTQENRMRVGWDFVKYMKHRDE